MAECSVKGYGTCSNVLIPRVELSDSDAALIRVRSGARYIASVCTNHKLNLLDLYEPRQQSCCDIFETHGKSIKKGLVVIDEDLVKLYAHLYKLIPGRKICNHCLDKLKAGKKPGQHEMSAALSSEDPIPGSSRNRIQE